MKKILILFVGLAFAQASAQDQPAVHGMLLVGEETLYLSHLPMFHSPHNYQVILEVRFKTSTLDPKSVYLL
jgi:hypothetical protein